MEKHSFEYPEYWSKYNAFFSLYADIAFENYVEANNWVLELKRVHDPMDSLVLRHKVENNYMVVIVFSIMCIESFLNDFLSKCLGDELYYSTYDGLSVESKMELAANLVFGEIIDKSREPYTSLKQTIIIRNDLVHNKSKDSSKMLEKEQKKLEALTNDELSKMVLHSDPCEACILSDQKNVSKVMREARVALKAITECAKFFSNKLPNANVYSQFFGGMRSDEDETEERIVQKRKFIKQLLK